MKTITTTLHSFTELSPEAQARVIQDRIKATRRHEDLTEHCAQEMVDSLKAVCEGCGLRLVDWSIGSYNQNWKATVRGNAEDYSGRRALAWFSRCLIEHGYARPARFAEMTFPGICGFTGVCYDDDVCEEVWANLLSGDDVSKAFDKVAYKLGQQLEKEEDYLCSEEYIRENLDETEEIYTEDGEEA